jgi:DNA-binding NtrC family response regulator
MARVLLVEPDRQIREFIAGILADCGHDVRQCNDAHDARQCLRPGSFDVVATDLVLGGQSDALVAMAQRLPVLTLSGRIFCIVADKYRHPQPLSEKPFRFDDLANLVKAIAACDEPEYALAA